MGETELEKVLRLGAGSWQGLCPRACPVFLGLQGLGWGRGGSLGWCQPGFGLCPQGAPGQNQPGTRDPYQGIGGEKMLREPREEQRRG